MTLESFQRPIRSFVRRQGRITPSQARALCDDWAQYGLTLPVDPSKQQPLDWQQLFGRTAPCMLEIGFGMGSSLIAMAKAAPEINFIGIEVHRPGIGHCLALAKKEGLTNLKVFCEDAKEVLEKMIVPGSIDKIMLFFPDPWPKRKHHKRRIVQRDFVQSIAQKLKVGGIFHLATDWQPYADHMLTTLEACPLLINHFGPGHFAPHTFSRLATKFERRGEKLGHAICDLVYQRRSD